MINILKIVPIIKETIEEHGIKYYLCDGFVDTVRQHWKHVEQFQNVREGIFQKKVSNSKKKQ